MAAENFVALASISLRDIGGRLRQIQKSGNKSPHVNRLLAILQKANFQQDLSVSLSVRDGSKFQTASGLRSVPKK